jgi:hypothetical protein
MDVITFLLSSEARSWVAGTAPSDGECSAAAAKVTDVSYDPDSAA